MADRDRVAAVRALEQSGGSLAMVDGLLASGSPSDLAARMKISARGAAPAGIGFGVPPDVSPSRVRSSPVGRTEAPTRAWSPSPMSRRPTDASTGCSPSRNRFLRPSTTEARDLAQAERAQARIDAERAAAAAAASAASGEATAGGIPKSYLALYRPAAATCSGLPWPVLAAIGQVESGHGTNTGPSSAGAMGPMQFLPSTFAAYAVDGDGDGTADIWSPADSIYSAAHYLCANGAGGGPRGLCTPRSIATTTPTGTCSWSCGWPASWPPVSASRSRSPRPPDAAR